MSSTGRREWQQIILKCSHLWQVWGCHCHCVKQGSNGGRHIDTTEASPVQVVSGCQCPGRGVYTPHSHLVFFLDWVQSLGQDMMFTCTSEKNRILTKKKTCFRSQLGSSFEWKGWKKSKWPPQFDCGGRVCVCVCLCVCLCLWLGGIPAPATEPDMGVWEWDGGLAG